VSDWKGDGTQKIFLLSSDEHQIGVTELDKNGGIAFPTILPIEGRPLTMAIGPLQPKAKPTLAVISEQDTNRVLITLTADGKSHTQKLSETFKASPSSMTMHDANQDGLADLVVLIPYEKIKVLIQKPDHTTFDEEDVLPPGGSTEEPWVSAADVDGDGKPELLLAQKNFIRAVVLKSDAGQGTNGKPAWSLLSRNRSTGRRATRASPGPRRCATGRTPSRPSFCLTQRGRR